MSTIDHGELFRPSGPTATIDYLRRRVQARDLTAPEALALLSALHNRLASGKIQEAGVYSSYSHLLRALELDMPDIHTYILSNWSASRRTRSELQPQNGSLTIDGLPGESSRPDAGESAANDFHEFMRSSLPQESPDSDPEDPGEAEEDGDEAATQQRATLAAADSAELDDEAVDPDADESSKEANDSGEEDQLEDAAASEESAQSDEKAPAEQEYQDESISEEAESDAEGAEAFESHESDTYAITGLSDTHAQSSAAEESEWPAEQELEPVEGLEPFEAPENEPPPLD